MHFAQFTARAVLTGLATRSLPHTDHRVGVTPNPGGLLVRQSGCDTGEIACGTGCIPAGADCCVPYVF
jgi:hypothetical protein